MLQGEWDEEKDPEAFRLGGKLPVAKADTPAEDGSAAGRYRTLSVMKLMANAMHPKSCPAAIMIRPAHAQANAPRYKLARLRRHL